MPELTAPIWRVTAGDYSVVRLHQFEVTSSRLAPVDLAQLRVPTVGLQGVEPGAPLTIEQGYRESGLWQIFTGTVRRTERQGDETIVHGADPMAPIVRHKVSRAFTGATPQEILRWALNETGTTAYQLSARRYPPRDRFVAEGTVGSVLAAVAAAWNLRADACWLPGVGVWWGPATESPRAVPAATITYGRNMLNHQVDPGGHRGRLTVVAMPLFHSQLISIVDPRTWSGERTVRIDRVTYRARPAEVVVEWGSLDAN